MKLNALTGFVLLAFGAVGCECLHQSQKPAPVAPVAAVAPAAVAEVRGAVLTAGSVPIPTTGLTLAEAIRQAGGVVATDATRDAGVLVSLQKGGANVYFSAAVIREGASGQIFLSPGDRVSVVPWTATDLFRGLKPAEHVAATAPLAAPTLVGTPEDILGSLLTWSMAVFPDIKVSESAKQFIRGAKPELIAGSKELRRVFLANVTIEPLTGPDDIKRWSTEYIDQVVQKKAKEAVKPRGAYDLDWRVLDALYQTGEKKPIVTIHYRVFSEWGEVTVDDGSKRVYFPKPAVPGEKLVAPGVPVTIPLPKLSLPTPIAFTEPHPRLLSAATFSQTLGVMVVRRLVNGVPTEFVLSRSSDASVQQLLRYALIHNGDELEITDPARLPVVTASLLAPLLQPNRVSAVDRERSMGFLRECLQDRIRVTGSPLKLPARP